ncbi:MAG: class II SORL domain-containing protein [Coriobacteriia bacterium]|nr:class II SORL domain-containing protein [Coriobacteriia bacterium]
MSDAPILGPVNHVVDLSTASDFEKKHTPHIEVDRKGDKTIATVTVGFEVVHPNQPDHYIAWIELYVDGAGIARFDLSPVATDPTVSVIISADAGSMLRAIAHCNLHGLWAAEVVL